MAGVIVSKRYLAPDSDDEWTEGEIVEDTEVAVSFTLGVGMIYETSDGTLLVQKDYKVDGEVWQVHKTDADPFPSKPHAHCVGGRENFVGKKLHLGTRQLHKGAKALNEFLPKKPVARLIELIKPKFPGLELPIPTEPSPQPRFH
jgi:hypothetical protein